MVASVTDGSSVWGPPGSCKGAAAGEAWGACNRLHDGRVLHGPNQKRLHMAQRNHNSNTVQRLQHSLVQHAV
jgi:hypothetical protein